MVPNSVRADCTLLSDYSMEKAVLSPCTLTVWRNNLKHRL